MQKCKVEEAGRPAITMPSTSAGIAERFTSSVLDASGCVKLPEADTMTVIRVTESPHPTSEKEREMSGAIWLMSTLAVKTGRGFFVAVSYVFTTGSPTSGVAVTRTQWRVSGASEPKCALAVSQAAVAAGRLFVAITVEKSDDVLNSTRSAMDEAWPRLATKTETSTESYSVATFAPNVSAPSVATDVRSTGGSHSMKESVESPGDATTRRRTPDATALLAR